MARLGRGSRQKPIILGLEKYVSAPVFIAHPPSIIGAKNKRRATARTQILKPSITGAPPQVRGLLTLTKRVEKPSRTPIIINGLNNYLTVGPVAAKPLIVQPKLGVRGKPKKPLIYGLISYSSIVAPIAGKPAMIQAKPRPRTQYRKIELGLYPYQPVAAPVAAKPEVIQAKPRPRTQYRKIGLGLYTYTPTTPPVAGTPIVYQAKPNPSFRLSPRLRYSKIILGLLRYQPYVPPAPPIPGPPIPLPSRSISSGSLLPETIMPPNIPIGTVMNDGKVQLDHNWYLLFYNLAFSTLGASGSIQSVTVGTSPFTFTASAPGSLLISGGNVTKVQITRQNATIIIPQTSGLFPLSKTDQITITYTVAPTLTFVPS